MGFFPALASNMLNMVGIGPFITIPLILEAMHGPQALVSWILGAVLSLCDGLVWAELGAAMPTSGGSYDYLQQGFGRMGRLMSFLFLWQVMLAAPLTAASGGVGFADYMRYLIPSLTQFQGKLVAVGVCLLSTFLLYRDIKSIGKISAALWVALMVAIGAILWGGAWHFEASRAFHFPAGAFALTPMFAIGLGQATRYSMYDYSGYFNVCLIGGEVEKPATNIPRVTLLSIIVLAVLYLAMSLSIIGVVPWQQAAHSQAIGSDYMERLYGAHSASFMTVLILIIAFASVFCVLLGYTRVPFAAAVEGHFFKAFGRVHPTGNFPSFSVLFMGFTSAALCFLPLDALINTLLVIQILTWFAPQCIGLMLIRRNRQDIERPFQMPLYPLPVVLAIIGWVFLFVTSDWQYMLSACGLVLFGTAAYAVRARKTDPMIARAIWLWIPVVISVFITPLCLTIGYISAGLGHGDYFWAKILFPFTMLSTVFMGSITPPFIVLAFVQYPVYGVILGLAAKNHRLLRTLGIVVAVHLLFISLCLAMVSRSFS